MQKDLVTEKELRRKIEEEFKIEIDKSQTKIEMIANKSKEAIKALQQKENEMKDLLSSQQKTMKEEQEKNAKEIDQLKEARREIEEQMRKREEAMKLEKERLEEEVAAAEAEAAKEKEKKEKMRSQLAILMDGPATESDKAEIIAEEKEKEAEERKELEDEIKKLKELAKKTEEELREESKRKLQEQKMECKMAIELKEKEHDAEIENYCDMVQKLKRKMEVLLAEKNEIEMRMDALSEEIEAHSMDETNMIERLKREREVLLQEMEERERERNKKYAEEIAQLKEANEDAMDRLVQGFEEEKALLEADEMLTAQKLDEAQRENEALLKRIEELENDGLELREQRKEVDALVAEKMQMIATLEQENNNFEMGLAEVEGEFAERFKKQKEISLALESEREELVKRHLKELEAQEKEKQRVSELISALKQEIEELQKEIDEINENVIQERQAEEEEKKKLERMIEQLKEEQMKESKEKAANAQVLLETQQIYQQKEGLLKKEIERLKGNLLAVEKECNEAKANVIQLRAENEEVKERIESKAAEETALAAKYEKEEKELSQRIEALDALRNELKRENEGLKNRLQKAEAEKAEAADAAREELNEKEEELTMASEQLLDLDQSVKEKVNAIERLSQQVREYEEKEEEEAKKMKQRKDAMMQTDQEKKEEEEEEEKLEKDDLIEDAACDTSDLCFMEEFGVQTEEESVQGLAVSNNAPQEESTEMKMTKDEPNESAIKSDESSNEAEELNEKKEKSQSEAEFIKEDSLEAELSHMQFQLKIAQKEIEDEKSRREAAEKALADIQEKKAKKEARKMEEESKEKEKKKEEEIKENTLLSEQGKDNSILKQAEQESLSVKNPPSPRSSIAISTQIQEIPLKQPTSQSSLQFASDAASLLMWNPNVPSSQSFYSKQLSEFISTLPSILFNSLFLYPHLFINSPSAYSLLVPIPASFPPLPQLLLVMARPETPLHIIKYPPVTEYPVTYVRSIPLRFALSVPASFSPLHVAEYSEDEGGSSAAPMCVPLAAVLLCRVCFLLLNKDQTPPVPALKHAASFSVSPILAPSNVPPLPLDSSSSSSSSSLSLSSSSSSSPHSSLTHSDSMVDIHSPREPPPMFRLNEAADCPSLRHCLSLLLSLLVPAIVRDLSVSSQSPLLHSAAFWLGICFCLLSFFAKMRESTKSPVALAVAAATSTPLRQSVPPRPAQKRGLHSKTGSFSLRFLSRSSSSLNSPLAASSTTSSSPPPSPLSVSSTSPSPFSSSSASASPSPSSLQHSSSSLRFSESNSSMLLSLLNTTIELLLSCCNYIIHRVGKFYLQTEMNKHVTVEILRALEMEIRGGFKHTKNANVLEYSDDTTAGLLATLTSIHAHLQKLSSPDDPQKRILSTSVVDAIIAEILQQYSASLANHLLNFETRFSVSMGFQLRMMCTEIGDWVRLHCPRLSHPASLCRSSSKQPRAASPSTASLMFVPPYSSLDDLLNPLLLLQRIQPCPMSGTVPPKEVLDDIVVQRRFEEKEALWEKETECRAAEADICAKRDDTLIETDAINVEVFNHMLYASNFVHVAPAASASSVVSGASRISACSATSDSASASSSSSSLSDSVAESVATQEKETSTVILIEKEAKEAKEDDQPMTEDAKRMEEQKMLAQLTEKIEQHVIDQLDSQSKNKGKAKGKVSGQQGLLLSPVQSAHRNFKLLCSSLTLFLEPRNSDNSTFPSDSSFSLLDCKLQTVLSMSIV
eukprot:MONOS_2485.1-p1 / transcript=MONOS_2485.1 / gene=MONOS_2485 / organism=Monocercomonoides_exilis_PA203 / gene_product=hypothetical protein GUITHDRAFT_109770 / transcript_product=hypothetical protein GUITHDRAFT_109770 / location=Mono_scaffold00051:146833-152238(-) / protein_length=1727 / sequence_SO=supercontig / SO=protein_coding / is_pseudo=false